MIQFRYHADILARYPNLVGGIVIAQGMTNGPSPEALQTEYVAEQKASIARVGKTPLSEVPSLTAWRRAFSAFGVDPTKYRSSAEALLRRLTKNGDIPSINTLVDIGNLVSIRYGLPIAVIDTQQIQGPLVVRFADGNEFYTPLHDTGESVVEHPEAGEVVFTDDARVVFARRWCWRQGNQSAAKVTTTSTIITIEAQHAGSHDTVKTAVEDMLRLLENYAGGRHTARLLDVGNAELAVQ
jgi:DNA/RNA-binding domain of Phe-tRNA-synthetase-like protein